ncbi:helix-turn-helix domain-containing protein [Serratia aquatilis]|uniref:Helix-turn-helix domain-containing protein n=1 Tax=Serratia aquatilis TaxID=1737515 RepID=A0ABV6E905_9GAMM
MKILDIGEVVQQSGLSPATLRYYEEIGLIASVGRNGLRRQFNTDVLLKLSLIALGKSAGFSLVEISGMFGKDGLPDLPRVNLHAKADELERQIRNLVVLKNALRHVADCPAPSHLECPTFRRLLLKASHRKKSKTKIRK